MLCCPRYRIRILFSRLRTRLRVVYSWNWWKDFEIPTSYVFLDLTDEMTTTSCQLKLSRALRVGCGERFLLFSRFYCVPSLKTNCYLIGLSANAVISESTPSILRGHFTNFSLQLRRIIHLSIRWSSILRLEWEREKKQGSDIPVRVFHISGVLMTSDAWSAPYQLFSGHLNQ